MMSLSPAKFTLSNAQKAKMSLATKQMQEIMLRVNKWVKYRLLSHYDKKQLIGDGFARDLVDNLVYVTERQSEKTTDSSSDRLSTGFTAIAFDPSIYGSEEIAAPLRESSGGRCSWCESYVAANDGLVCHYRPPIGYDDGKTLNRDAYYELAYQTENLLYSCRHCSETYKADHFPTAGNNHMPKVNKESEVPILLNPRVENPRQYVRFNPLNAKAYSFDRVLKFYQDTQNKGNDEIEHEIYLDPTLIPNQLGCTGEQISQSRVTSEYLQWLHQQTGGEAELLLRGETSIDILGLNRPSLIHARAAHLRDLRGMYLAAFSAPNSPETQALKTRLKSWRLGNFANNGMDVSQFLSLTQDALNTWMAQDDIVSD